LGDVARNAGAEVGVEEEVRVATVGEGEASIADVKEIAVG